MDSYIFSFLNNKTWKMIFTVNVFADSVCVMFASPLPFCSHFFRTCQQNPWNVRMFADNLRFSARLVRHQKTVPGCYRSHFQTAKHCFPWKYRIISTCTKNPHPKKQFDCILWMFLWGGPRPLGEGAGRKCPSLEKVMKQNIACEGLYFGMMFVDM